MDLSRFNVIMMAITMVKLPNKKRNKSLVQNKEKKRLTHLWKAQQGSWMSGHGSPERERQTFNTAANGQQGNQLGRGGHPQPPLVLQVGFS